MAKVKKKTPKKTPKKRPKKKKKATKGTIEREREDRQKLPVKKKRGDKVWCPDTIEINRANWRCGDNGGYHKRAGAETGSILELICVAAGFGRNQRDKVLDFEAETWISEVIALENDTTITNEQREMDMIAKLAEYSISAEFYGEFRPRVKPARR